jgi:hypothetical protein
MLLNHVEEVSLLAGRNRVSSKMLVKMDEFEQLANELGVRH